MYKWWQIKNTIIMVWYWLLAKVGYKLSTDPIPDDTYYCYVPDVERNEVSRKFFGEKGVYYTKPCPYYIPLGKEYTGCAFLGVITDDMIFGDQCKICGEKEIDIDGE